MEEKSKEKSLGDAVVRVLNGMAQGLFASLIIGLIIKQIGTYTHIDILAQVGQVAQYMTGPAIGIGVAAAVGAPPLAMFSAAACGAVGAGTVNLTTLALSTGEPLGAAVAALVGALCGRWIAGRTKLDIMLVPITTIVIGSLVGVFLSPAVSALMNAIGAFINQLTRLYPFPMGVLVSVVVGMVLTLPISSAAICISLGLEGLAAGAACCGCCCQMIGFAAASFRENGVGGLVSQGLGTSMLQIPNIWKNWRIWVPPTLCSAVLGPVSTCLFRLENNASGAGMGTSGLVGQFNAVAVMGPGCIWQLVLLHFVLPAVVTLLISEFMRRRGWIRPGDMKLA